MQAIQKSIKVISTRHPFERLLSAYRDKFERPNRSYYYKKYGNHIISSYQNEQTGINSVRQPTFSQFLKFIISEKNFDEHWRPYYIECDPCGIEYDYILKLDNLHIEEKYLFKVLNVSRTIKNNKNVDNINPNGRTDHNISKQYFSKVKEHLLRDIYELYEKDFLIFGYSPNWYYELTIK